MDRYLRVSLLRRMLPIGMTRNPEDYGISISSPEWVCDRLTNNRPELRIVSFCERAWDDHQDAVGCTLQPV